MNEKIKTFMELLESFLRAEESKPNHPHSHRRPKPEELVYQPVMYMPSVVCLSPVIAYPPIQYNMPSEATPTGQWTDKKAYLVELIYALYEAKSINRGEADIKTITAAFEQVFDVQLGDVYNTFKEIRMRKGRRTVYLDKLVDALNRRMEEQDAR